MHPRMNVLFKEQLPKKGSFGGNKNKNKSSLTMLLSSTVFIFSSYNVFLIEILL